MSLKILKTSYGVKEAAKEAQDAEVQKCLDKNDKSAKQGRWRKLLQKNVMEKLACSRKKKTIEKQIHSRQQELTRQEKELKTQLNRLQDQQQQPEDEDGSTLTLVSDITCQFDDNIWSSEEEEGAVNPYPVTIIPVHNMAAPSKVIMHHESTDIRTWYKQKSRRRQSAEFEDLNIQTSTGNLTRPTHIRARDGARVPFLSRCQSLLGIKRHINNLNHENDRHVWVGEPEAINSVRRPLRPRSKLKSLAKSCSFDDDCGSSVGSVTSLARDLGSLDLGTTRVSSPAIPRRLNRHCSYKDQASPKESSPHSAVVVRSRHLSLKKQKRGSVRNYNESHYSPVASPIGSPPQQLPSIICRRKRFPLSIRPVAGDFEALHQVSGQVSPVSVSSPSHVACEVMDFPTARGLRSAPIPIVQRK